MQKLELIGAILISIATASSAWAGKEAHGGNGVVCRGANGAIKSVRLLDFYEGEVLYGLSVPEDSSAYTNQYQRIAKKLDLVSAPFKDIHQTTFESVNRSLKFLQSGVTLDPIEDSDRIINAPTGCSVEQLAAFTTDGTIYVVGDYWKLMTPTQQAGLIVHEGVYQLQRYTARATSSYRSRRVVAYAFTNAQFTPVLKSLPAGARRCYSVGSTGPGALFYVYNLPGGGWGYQFLITPDGLTYSLKRAESSAPNSSGLPPIPGDICSTPSKVGSDFESEELFSACQITRVTPNGVESKAMFYMWPKAERQPASGIEFQCDP